jgi:UDP-glucose 4-epimerase
MRVLITGGAGFIGSHLAEHLIDLGHEVFIIDNLCTGSVANLAAIHGSPKLHLTIEDISNESVLDRLVSRADQVYHLAAAVGVRRVMQRPVDTLASNVKGTEALLRVASRYGKKLFIASSSEVYGNRMDDTPLNEDDPCSLGPVGNRRWAYACSKTMGEVLALAYHQERGLPVVVGRLFNAVGPRQSGEHGMVLPNFVQSGLAGRPITVHGDGRQTRSFAHVSDVVRAMATLMASPAAEGDVVNIGNDEEVSIDTLAHQVREMTGARSEIRYISYAQAYGHAFDDMRYRRPDLSKIRRLTGLKPRYRLDEIIRSVIDHFQAGPAPTPTRSRHASPTED